MISAFLYLSFLGTSISALTVQEIPAGTFCPAMTTVPDFDITQFTGLWFEHAKFGPEKENNSICVTHKYILQEDNSIILHRSRYDPKDEKIKKLKASIRIPDPTDPAKLKIEFPNNHMIPESNYWIIATDYTNYAISYSCNKINGSSLVQKKAWLLARGRWPSLEFLQYLTKIAESYDIDTSRFVTTGHIECKKGVRK